MKKNTRIVSLFTAMIAAVILTLSTAANAQVKLLSPANNSTVKEKPTFKWTPVQPSRPGGGYRLEVYKVEKGQDAAQVYKRPIGRPIIIRDYKATEAAWPAEVALAGGNYAWGIQVIDANEKPSGEKTACYQYVQGYPLLDKD